MPNRFLPVLLCASMFALSACFGGGSSGGGGGGNGADNGGDSPDNGDSPEPDGGDGAVAEGLELDGPYDGETDWAFISSADGEHVLAADMAFLVREMEVPHLTVMREFLEGNLQHSDVVAGGCGGTFTTDITSDGNVTESAGSGTFADFCIPDPGLSGAAIDPYVLVSGSATWDDVSVGVSGTSGTVRMEDVVVAWRGEEFTLNSLQENKGANRFYAMDVTLNDTTYRFYQDFIPDTGDGDGAVFWLGLHPEFGKFRIDQDLLAGDEIFSYGSAGEYPDCLGPVTGAQTMSEPENSASFQFRATGDCRTFELEGADSAGESIDSDDHEWLDALIESSADSD